MLLVYKSPYPGVKAVAENAWLTWHSPRNIHYRNQTLVKALITRSFSAEDLAILRSVLDSAISVNVQKIDLITDQFRKIRNALLQAETRLQVGPPRACATDPLLPLFLEWERGPILMPPLLSYGDALLRN